MYQAEVIVRTNISRFSKVSAPKCECWSLPATSKQWRVHPGDTAGSGQSPAQSTSPDP